MAFSSSSRLCSTLATSFLQSPKGPRLQKCLLSLNSKKNPLRTYRPLTLLTSAARNETSKPSRRRGKKKEEEEEEEDPDSAATSLTFSTSRKKTRTTRSTKSPKEKPDPSADAAAAGLEPQPPLSSGKMEVEQTVEEGKRVEKDEEDDEDMGDFEDEEDDDFTYMDPPLVCCFGAAQWEFLPSVRVSHLRGHPDKYSTWKMLQWDPPEFSRTPGGPPSNVAISHVRLGGRAAFMGMVGDDFFGNDLVLKMNMEKVQTRAMKIEPGIKTATSHMKIKFREGDGRMVAKTITPCAEDSFSKSDLNIGVLKEARILHFNAGVLLTPSTEAALFRAIKLSKKFGGTIFFDPNFPLSLWESPKRTWDLIQKAWKQSHIIQISKQELEFLLGERKFERIRSCRPQYYAESYEDTKRSFREYYHYTTEDISPLWHDDIKFLFVTDGTFRIHYYTPEFDGVVVGTEDVLITPFTCDRTGSGDAVVAAIMRKLTIHPEMSNNQDFLERQLRFAIAAGIIAQWTVGAVRGFPTESAAKNLKEQVYVPSMW